MSLELDNLGSGFNRSKLNSNTQKTEDYVNDNLLHRDGVASGQDNSMKVNLDMNSYRILNLPAPSSPSDPIRLSDLEALGDNVTISYDSEVRVFDTVALLKASDTLSVGQVAETKGYYSANGAGGAKYLIVSGGTGTEDDGEYHNLDDGKQAKLLNTSTSNVYQFGAKGDNSFNDTTYIKNYISFLDANGLDLEIPSTDTYFVISDELVLPDNMSVKGNGWKSAIRQSAQNKGIFVLGDNCSVSNCRLKVIDGDNTAFVNCIYGNDVKNPRITNNFLNSAGGGGNGVHLRDTFQSIIKDNVIYGGTWGGGAGTGATSADILFYSTSNSSRHTISGNYCLSNNSQGIISDALGRDSELVVTGNICITLDPATCVEGGAWSEVATGGIRRHGILAGYNDPADDTSSVIIADNICKNTRWTGIYCQATGTVPRKIIISNNICIDNGFETGNTLAGGIYLSKAGNEQLIGNTIHNFRGSAGSNVGAITVNGTSATDLKTVVKDNHIVDSLAHGVSLSTNATAVIVEGNNFNGTVASDVFWSANAGNTSLGGHIVCRNTIERVNATAAAINFTAQASTNVTKIFGNIIKGHDNTTVADTNTALRTTAPVGVIQFYDNFVENFYYGVYNSSFLSGTRVMNAGLDRNTFKDCEKGMAVGAVSNVVTIPLFDNVFENVTTNIDGRGGFVAGKEAIRLGSNIQVFVTSVPTTGSWAVGDRAYNSASAVGQPKAWRYASTSAWVSEGAL